MVVSTVRVNLSDLDKK